MSVGVIYCSFVSGSLDNELYKYVTQQKKVFKVVYLV